MEILMRSNQTLKVSKRKSAGLHMLHTALAEAKKERQGQSKDKSVNSLISMQCYFPNHTPSAG